MCFHVNIRESTEQVTVKQATLIARNVVTSEKVSIGWVGVEVDWSNKHGAFTTAVRVPCETKS